MGRRKQTQPRSQRAAAPAAPAAVEEVDFFEALSMAVANRQLEINKRSAADTAAPHAPPRSAADPRDADAAATSPPQPPRPAPPTGPAADAARDTLKHLHGARAKLPEYRREHVDAVEEALEGKLFIRAEQGRRAYMEDRYSVDADDARLRLYGVYDGHGGNLCSELCRTQLMPLLRAQPDLRSDPAAAILRVFELLDAVVCEFSESVNGLQDGTTATVAVVQTAPDGAQTITVGNVGDSRCVLVQGDAGDARDLTRDHAGGLPDERARIEQLGGFLLQCGGILRVQGCLAVSRALGDASFKPFVTGTPETTTVALPAGAAPALLCIASDGVWDEISTEEMGALLAVRGCCDGARTALQLAKRRGSEDNLTILAVDLRAVAADAAAEAAAAAAEAAADAQTDAQTDAHSHASAATSPAASDADSHAHAERAAAHAQQSDDEHERERHGDEKRDGRETKRARID